MGRWKEKRKKVACNKLEHKLLEQQVVTLRSDIQKEIEYRANVVRSTQITIDNLRQERDDYQGALIKASLLVEVQQKQMETIKLILGFFEPAKSISVSELKALQRVAKDVSNRTEDTSNARTPRPNSNC